MTHIGIQQPSRPPVVARATAAETTKQSELLAVPDRFVPPLIGSSYGSLPSLTPQRVSWGLLGSAAVAVGSIGVLFGATIGLVPLGIGPFGLQLGGLCIPAGGIGIVLGTLQIAGAVLAPDCLLHTLNECEEYAAERDLVAGMRLLEAGDERNARVRLQRAYDAAPMTVRKRQGRIFELIGCLNERAGDLHGAAQFYYKWLSVVGNDDDGEHARALFATARVEIAVGKLELARGRLLQVMECDSMNAHKMNERASQVLNEL